MFSFGHFPGVLVLLAEVSEPSIGSIFMGRWMKNDWDGTCGIFIPEGVVVGSGGANGRESDRAGRMESQQVVKGEAYISASAGGITIVY